MKFLLIIGTGSFIGGIFRFLLSGFIQGKMPSAFPYGTIGVNITGCFIIGVIFGIGERFTLSQEWRLFLITGILGGFTTFSAFSNETVNLLRDGQYWSASVYVLSSLIFGLIATFIGISATKAI